MPDANAYCFVGQLNWWEPRDSYQAAYQSDRSGWDPVTVPFITTSAWRGSTPNRDVDDRGWGLGFRILFARLGLSAPPPQGTVWGLAMILHDRDAPGTTPRW